MVYFPMLQITQGPCHYLHIAKNLVDLHVLQLGADALETAGRSELHEDGGVLLECLGEPLLGQVEVPHGHDGEDVAFLGKRCHLFHG